MEATLPTLTGRGYEGLAIQERPVWRNPLATGLLESLPFLHEHAAIPSTAACPEPLKT